MAGRKRLPARILFIFHLLNFLAILLPELLFSLLGVFFMQNYALIAVLIRDPQVYIMVNLLLFSLVLYYAACKTHYFFRSLAHYLIISFIHILLVAALGLCLSIFLPGVYEVFFFIQNSGAMLLNLNVWGSTVLYIALSMLVVTLAAFPPLWPIFAPPFINPAEFKGFEYLGQ